VSDGVRRQTWIADAATLIRPSGTEHHPVHREVLSQHARSWMPEVRRFYERRLTGVDLTSGCALWSASDGGGDG